MKRFFLIASLSCLVMSATVANDVGAANVQLQTCQLDMQHNSLLPAMFTPVVLETTPVVCITQDKQLMAVDFKANVANPDGLLFIDPGICTQVSKSTIKFNQTNRYNIYSYTPYKLNEYNLCTRNCKLMVVMTRHV